MNETLFKKHGWPINPSIDLLKQMYNGWIPPAEEFETSDMDRFQLFPFMKPFVSHFRKLENKFEYNLDKPLDVCFEEQLNKFIDNVLKNEREILTVNTKTVLRRMGRAGYLYRHGFNPKPLIS